MNAQQRHDQSQLRLRTPWRIEDILARTDLAALLDEVAEPAAQMTDSRRWHCPVPGHDDHHASVTIHIDATGHERWRCWSGDETHRGDAVDLVELTQGLDQPSSLEWLARRAGLTPGQPLPEPLPRTKPPPPQAVSLDPAVARYARACHNILWSRQGHPVREWLAQRGLRPGVVRANLVGADPGWQWMHRKPGLPHGNRVGATFPAFDEQGEIRYVQTRYLTGRGPKYDNPASHLGTNPRLSWAVPARTPTLYPHLAERLLIVCEGIPDALVAAQEGFKAAAVLGAQYPDASVAARLATRAEHDNLDLVAVVDNDSAGRRWGQRLDRALNQHDQNLTIVEPTTGADLNEWAQRDASWPGQLIAAPLLERDDHRVEHQQTAEPAQQAAPTTDIDLP